MKKNVLKGKTMRVILGGLFLSMLLAASAFANSITGSYAVLVPSKNPFTAIVTLKNGQVTGFSMERNEIVGLSANSSAKSIVLDARFSGRCGDGSSGQMKIDVSDGDLVFRQWKGRCASRNANFNVKKKIKMTKQ